MPISIEDGLVSVQELASKLAISTRGIWRIIQRGELGVVRIGRRTLISRAEVATWLAGRQVAPAPTPSARSSGIARQFLASR